MNTKLLFTTIILFAYISCVKKENISTLPSIEYVGMSYVGLSTTQNNPFFRVVFTYKDGDGDFGQDDNDDSKRLKVTAFYYIGAKLDSSNIDKKLQPFIDNPFQKQKQGTVTVDLIYNYIADSNFYKIQIQDRSGNFSNIITTETKRPI